MTDSNCCHGTGTAHADECQHESGCEHPVGSDETRNWQTDELQATHSDGTASPELMAGLPRQTKVRMWEQVTRLVRPAAHELPPPPERIHRRWDRLVRLVGDNGLHRLLGSHVTVFGLGGVGSYAVESLARSAVGRLTLVDFDDVCVTNINRQLQAMPGTVGQSKAALLAERVRAIHPEAWVDPVQAFYDLTTSDLLLSPQPDLVIDAIDNVTSKVLLLETCLGRGIPVISVTGAGARLDPTQVRIADLTETKVDPLARVLRKELCDVGLAIPNQPGSRWCIRRRKCVSRKCRNGTARVGFSASVRTARILRMPVRSDAGFTAQHRS